MRAPLQLSPRRELCFACPTCGADLRPAAGGLRCAAGHMVNVAKQGHIHLLPPAKVDAAAQAEDDEIARASRAFYDAGGFQVQVEGVAAEVARALAQGGCEGRAQVLDAGCGEGAYLRQLGELLGDGAAQCWGTDTRKLAVRYAATRQRSARFAIASPHSLPFADGSFDLVFSVFAPSPWEEFCRVLRPGGAIVVARAGSGHLRELRARAGVEDRAARPPKEFSAGLAENYVRLRSEETLRGEAARALLQMTPFVRHAPPDARRSLERQEELSTTADFIVSTHRVWLGAAGGRFEV